MLLSSLTLQIKSKPILNNIRDLWTVLNLRVIKWNIQTRRHNKGRIYTEAKNEQTATRCHIQYLFHGSIEAKNTYFLGVHKYTAKTIIFMHYKYVAGWPCALR